MEKIAEQRAGASSKRLANRCWGNQRKGQASTEYILLLSVMLVLVLVVVSFVVDVPGMLRMMTARGNNDFWANADISVKAFTYNSDGKLVMVMQNSKTYPISLKGININGEEAPLDAAFEPGEKRTITVAMGPCSSGNVYSLDLVFLFYDNDDRSRGLLTYGPGIPLTGKCEQAG